LFNDNAIWVEFRLKLFHHGGGQFGFDISNSTNLNFFDEVTDFLVAFFLEKLLKSVWPKVVEKLFGIFFVSLLRSTDMEVDPKVY